MKVSRRLQYGVLLGALCVTAIAVTVHSQGTAASPTVDDLLDRVRQGQFTPTIVNLLVEARDVRAIPVLKEQFAVSTNPVEKQALASGLVRLGDRDAAYWDFLAERARTAVESDAPFPGAFDAQGQSAQQQLSPDFTAWAKANGLQPESAGRVHMSELPLAVTFLAMTGDPRGLAVLRRGMSSRNYLVQAVAAKGLAKLQDANSIPLIIAACQKAPADAASLIARALVFFVDSRAETAAATFITNREVLAELRRISREKGTSALF